jgi:hypothetical protein
MLTITAPVQPLQKPPLEPLTLTFADIDPCAYVLHDTLGELGATPACDSTTDVAWEARYIGAGPYDQIAEHPCVLGTCGHVSGARRLAQWLNPNIDDTVGRGSPRAQLHLFIGDDDTDMTTLGTDAYRPVLGGGAEQITLRADATPWAGTYQICLTITAPHNGVLADDDPVEVIYLPDGPGRAIVNRALHATAGDDNLTTVESVVGWVHSRPDQHVREADTLIRETSTTHPDIATIITVLNTVDAIHTTT